MIKRTLIIDVQILQTPALERGMGQYVSSLIIDIDRQAKKNHIDVYLVYSDINKNGQKETRKFLNGLENCKKVGLPLVDYESTSNTKKAMQHNRAILDEWVRDNVLGGATFLVTSLFQAEIYPVFPADVSRQVIVYDVIPLQLFKTYKSKMRWADYLSRFSELYAAEQVFCISKATANDLQVFCSVDPKKLIVINGGPGELEASITPRNKLDKKFLLMPTGNDLRKNNKNAILGFEHYRLKNHTSLYLVITSYFSKQEKRDLQRLSPNVIFTGSIPNDELTWYYKNCEALLFPSLYEGLGMPIIEAMLFGKPVIASGIEAFMEISEDLPYYFNPHEPINIAEALERALTDDAFADRKKRYPEVTKEYTWENTVSKVLDFVGTQVFSHVINKPKIAIAGPYPSGVSAIGKFISVLHPYLLSSFDVDYYFESSPIDKELRPNILEHMANQYSIRALSDKKIKEYDAVFYHIGNSNHHTITAARALLHPGIVITHDLNFENIYKDMRERRMIDDKRFEVEGWLNEGHPVKYLYSILSRQKAVIAHSEYAKNIVEKLVKDCDTNVGLAQLAVDTPINYVNAQKESFTIGLAGILANIKGLQAIEDIARDVRFKYDKILVFGLNFAEKGVLDRLRELPNVEVATDLTDYQFQQNIKRMSVFVNYRTAYQGEASYSTLETMRYGIPVIVRGDFGWYSELPEGSVIKVSDTDEVMKEVQRLKTEGEYMKSISETARKATASIYGQQQYVDAIVRIIDGLREDE